MATILKRHTIDSVQRAATAAGYANAHVFKYESWQRPLEHSSEAARLIELNKGTWYALSLGGEVVARRRTLAELTTFIERRSKQRGFSASAA